MSHVIRTSRRRAAIALTTTIAAGALLTSYAAAPGQAAPGQQRQPLGSTATGTHERATVDAVAMPSLAPVAAARSGSATGSTADAATETEVAPRATKEYGLLGVTWARDTGTKGVAVEVRTRSAGTWTTWQPLEVDDENDGDGPSTRQGTEPLWVGSADGVAARVTSRSGSTPKDVKIDLVDPGTGPAAGSVATAQRPAASAASPSYTAIPSMVSRSQWGARPNNGCDSPRYGSRTLGVVVHHTAGSNSYSQSQSPAVVRGIQAFHMNGRGWCDIGYDFLIDKYGTIYEGRSGGVLYQVRGAHAGNFTVNTYAMGVSMMGNLDTVAPTAAEKASVVKVIGWRLGTNYVKAGGTWQVNGHHLNRISGHRDVYNSGIRPGTSTACPGRYGYAWLTSTASSGLRQQVASYISGYDTPISERAAFLGRSVTGPVYVGEAPIPGTGGYKTRFSRGDVYSLDASTGPHLVSSKILTEYKAVHGVKSPLGFPTSDQNTSGVMQAQRFQHGTVYQAGSAAYALTEKTDDKYRDLDQSGGRLGVPTSRTLVMSNGVNRTYFAHGAIRYHTDTGEYVVKYS